MSKIMRQLYEEARLSRESASQAFARLSGA